MKKICLKFRTKYKLPIYDTLSFLELMQVPRDFVWFFKNAFLNVKLYQKFWRTEVELVRLAHCIALNLFCYNLRIKLLAMYFLKLPASGNNEPKKGNTPITTMDNTEISLRRTRYSWYIVSVLYSLMRLMFCESSLFQFILCYFICYVKKTYLFIEKQIVIFLRDFVLDLSQQW